MIWFSLITTQAAQINSKNEKHPGRLGEMEAAAG